MDPVCRHRRNYNEAGHAHELTFSCYKSHPFLKAERTCRWLAEAIEKARVVHAFDLWAFVFMPEHVHLIIHPRCAAYDLASIRYAIKLPVAKQAIQFLKDKHPEWLPRVTRRRGNREERLFWQSGGGYDRNIVEAATLLSMVDYIHLNPVRRGLVARAVEWRWSSAAYYENGAASPLALDSIPPEWLNG